MRAKIKQLTTILEEHRRIAPLFMHALRKTSGHIPASEVEIIGAQSSLVAAATARCSLLCGGDVGFSCGKNNEPLSTYRLYKCIHPPEYCN